MNKPAEMSLSQQLAAAQEWWRGAGVDYDYLDEAEPWLAEIEPDAPVVAPAVTDAPVEKAPEPAKPLVEAGDLPNDLSAFQEWLCSPELPFRGAGNPSLAPRGGAEAKVMVIVPSPEQSDREALLEGAQGRLIANILRALGLGEDHTYLASALPSAMAEPDWMALHTQGLGAVLTHHIALAKPQRVLLFGRGLPLLLGHAPDAPPENLTEIDSPAGKLPVLTSFAPDRLLGHARQRARLWHRLLNWMD